MDKHTAVIVEEHFPIAFVGDKRAIPFSPTEKQIGRIEKTLAIYLKTKQPKLFKKYAAYYRQYTGLEIVGVRKVVRGNFLCHVDGDSWRKQWILMMDGGDCYFNFSYDADKDEIFEFDVNGEA